MIWNDSKIIKWAESGGVTPFDVAMVNGASIDLQLSDQVCRLSEIYSKPTIRYGDKEAMAMLWRAPDTYSRLLLYPGECVLLSTMEVVRLPNGASAQLLSKSTAGRCLIEHFHSGYVDCGFIGSLTLEITNFSPVVWDLRPGDRLVQLVLSDMTEVAARDYGSTGRYQHQILPTAPRGW